MRLATLICWLVTVSLGAFMLRTWMARGGPARERARDGGLPPPLIAGHAVLALAGLLVWCAFLATGARALAWAAVGDLAVTVGLGMCTVTLWTPYPARRPGDWREPRDEVALIVPDTAAGAADDPGADTAAGTVTDEMIARLIEESGPDYAAWSRPVRPDLAILVPVMHGFVAFTTFVLAVLAAAAV